MKKLGHFSYGNMRGALLFYFLLFFGFSLQCSVVRFMGPDQVEQWGVIDIYTSQQTDNILILRNSEQFPSTLQLFSSEHYHDVYNACFNRNEHYRNQIWETIEIDRVEILSPVSSDTSVFTNHHGYTIQKTPGSIGSPNSAVMKAPFISLLDLEVSLGFLVIKDMTSNEVYNRDTIGDYIGGIVLMNTFFSKDMEIMEGSTLNSHNLPSFTKVGPYIVLLSETDILADVLENLVGSIHISTVQKSIKIPSDVIDRLCGVASAVSKGHTGRRGNVLQIQLSNADQGQDSWLFTQWDKWLNFLLGQSSYRSAVLWYYNNINNYGFLSTGTPVKTNFRSRDNVYDLGTQKVMIRPDILRNWVSYQPAVQYEGDFWIVFVLSALVWVVLIAVGLFFLFRFKRKVKKE